MASADSARKQVPCMKDLPFFVCGPDRPSPSVRNPEATYRFDIAKTTTREALATPITRRRAAG